MAADTGPVFGPASHWGRSAATPTGWGGGTMLAEPTVLSVAPGTRRSVRNPAKALVGVSPTASCGTAGICMVGWSGLASPSP